VTFISVSCIQLAKTKQYTLGYKEYMTSVSSPGIVMASGRGSGVPHPRAGETWHVFYLQTYST